ncbi:MAG: hypothetical protein JWM82_3308 [Myxococcales bacterium]|nr:hypothetical protein [Myxococcales bacterium]
MRTISAIVLLVTSALGAGCAHRAPERRPAPPEARAEYRGEWIKLGERWVEGAHDRDVIPVGAREGTYRRIMIVVENSALEMYDVDVTFGDGSVFSPHTRHIFAADTRSHVIDLPGASRTIRDVQFRYGNLPGGGRAKAELWAE